MERPYLFLAGEFRVSMPAVFRRENWQHTKSPKKLFINNNGTLRRGDFSENIKGVIYFNRTSDFELEKHNLSTIIESGIPCWPDPKILLGMSSRHETLLKCKQYIDHFIFQGTYNYFYNHYFAIGKYPIDYPFVLKTGESHQGQDKHLIDSHEDFISFEGIATAEPFFRGESCRVLFIGNNVFGIKYFNDQSWIKNSAGADIEMFQPPNDMIDHANKIKDIFGLEITGLDYILEPDGKFHFLEINQYPGLDVSDETNEIAQKLLNDKMEWVENGTSNN